MKYLDKTPMVFAYGKGSKPQAAQKNCPTNHKHQSYKGGTWFCADCGKDVS